jgi:hypothetical protein
VDEADVVDQMEIHILVHVGLFKALARGAGGQEEVGFNIDVVSSMFFLFETLVKELLIGLKVGGGSHEFIHLLF